MNPVQWYYSNFNVQYYFLHYLNNREFAFFPAKTKYSDNRMTKRNLRVHNIQGFQFWLNRMHFFDSKNINYNCVNFYYSLATFKNGLPMTDPKNISLTVDKAEWNANAYKEIVAYDMVIDIDSGTHEEIDFAIDSAKMIKRLFDSYKIPYYLRFSGMGFHFVIPYRFFPLILSLNPHDKTNIYSYMSKIGDMMHDDLSELVDLGVYDSRRVLKIPYSLAIYENETYLCQPINDFKKFDINGMRLGAWDKNFKCDALHNPDGNLKYFKRLIK